MKVIKKSGFHIERNLGNLLKKWLQKEYITNKNTLRSSDYLLSKAYKFTKIHKKNIPYRIIVSSMEHTFLHDLISKNIRLPTSHVNNSFDLYKSFSNIKIPHTA